MMRRDGCVGQLQVQSAQAAAVPLGFICGSLPVPTVNPASNPLSPTQAAALVPAINLLSQRTGAPRYRLLPTETDLNTAPSHGVSCDELLPVAATSSHDTSSSNGLCNTWEGGYLMQPLARKCESLAVSALTGYGDEIDVVAPVDILKQIFKTPYSKSRLSVAVHRVGHTLILNSGPDIEEGEKIARRKKSQAKAMEKNLFSKFVQHSVHDEGPDSPKTCDDSSEGTTPKKSSTTRRQPPGTVPPGFGSLKSPNPRVPWQVCREDSFSESTSCCSEEDDVRGSSTSRGSNNKKGGKQRVVSRRNGCEGGGSIDFHQKSSSKFMREQQQHSNFIPKDPDMPPRQSATENFLRVLFWQFQNLRMLLGSDLLLFSNEKHAAVSLHLMEIGRQVTPLMWLDAWLDNVMASIPELAVCYHRNGVVQGYELLKTDDIFLLKGLSEDGTAFFSPHVVQQNASSVLRFLQENCKQDPGTYWLFKNAGEDLMQLFDLSVISKTRNTCGDKEESECGTLPSSRNRGNGHYSLPLAMLLYRLANRLSRSQDPADRMKCAKLFGKCLEYMDEQEHLVIRASAHEHAARLILACYKQLGVMLQPLLLEDKQEPASLELPSIEDSTTVIHVEESPAGGDVDEVNPPGNLSGAGDTSESTTPPTELVLANVTSTSVVSTEPVPPHVVQALADPVSARLAAVHHLSQAIKSLRWQRQLHAAGENQPKLNNNNNNNSNNNNYTTECVCGEPECVAICDFRDIEVGFGMDEKLRKLLLLLGESYLTLGEAYKEDGQFSRALKAAEFACLTRGSTPRLKEDTSSTKEIHNKGLFWGQVWGLVGDVFAEAQRTLGGDTDVNIIKLHQEPGEELKMAQEVMKEVKRLKKKVGSCEICSLTSCSCQSDRASSGISASSSSPTTRHTRQKLHAAKKSTNNTKSSDRCETAIVEAVVIEEKRPEIFSYLRRSAEMNDWEKNLSAASECYSAAVDAFADSTIHVQDYESALRKKGWACNELGRRRLAKGDVKSAEAAFETAIVAFRAVKDIPNIVLVYCNLAHGRRAAAEVFASQLDNNNPDQIAFLTTVGEARFLYQEALEFYGEARKELLAVERTMQRGLCNEVYTQFAHTYLKLGMLLAREDKFLNMPSHDRKQAAASSQGGGGMMISAKEAISKALVLYESMGGLRAQEAAYAQFQLGCQQRDSCLFVVQADHENNHSQIQKQRDSRLQGAKRLASMADRYWQKALEFYHADTHPDMFLQILMERSALCLAVAPASSHAGSEQALKHLLEGCRAVKFSTVSADITAAFTLQLQRLLKTMLGAALSASKPNYSCNSTTAPTSSSRSRLRNEIQNGSSISPGSKANDVALLKQMYGCALKLGGPGNDFGVLYSMWHT